ncbi:hypothetical protein L208DRAFT_1410426, partial [Tricholoma matsutake]
MGYWCWCQHICCSSLSVLPLMKNEHHLFRCSQPWRVVFCLFEGSPIRIVVGQEHRDPLCEQWLAGLEAGAVSSLSRFVL